MRDRRAGVLLVTDGGRLMGTFTERDVRERVVLGKRDPETTSIHEVMTAPVWTIGPDQTVDDALGLMLEHRIRHLPVVEDGRVEGVVSLRYMLRDKAEGLVARLDSLSAYLSADGIGG
jgi:CBS domain-containing protein